MENKKSGIKGITWNQHRNKWVVRTTVNGEPIYGNCWDNLADAKKRLKEINPELFRKDRKKRRRINNLQKKAFRKEEIREAKEYLKINKIRELKYNKGTDKFEINIPLVGWPSFFGFYYSFDEAIKKYYQWKDAKKYWYDTEKRRRGIMWLNEEWISFIYINGKRKEIGRFEDYLDAFDATVRAENENPDFDAI